MGRLFNYDNGIMQTLGKLFDIICLNVLWIMCCIPIFTIGASSAAYYYAYNKAIRQKRSYAWKEFFHGLRINFKQGTAGWLIVLLLYIVTGVDLYILGQMSSSMKFAGILSAIIMAVMLLMTMWLTYLFPYLARFENKTKAVMKNSAIIMVAKLPWSLLLLVLFVVTAGLFLLLPGLGMVAPAVYIPFATMILERVFRKYMAPEDLEAEKEIDMYRKR